MARNIIEQREWENSIAEGLPEYTEKFIFHKDRLQQIFDSLQSLIDDPDLPGSWQTVVTNKRNQGKILVQNMLDGIA